MVHLVFRRFEPPAPGPTVIGLRDPVSPAAVAWLVVSVVVDSVECQPLWALAHVVQERLKAVEPAGAARDAALYVVLSCRVVGVADPLLHVHPALVRAAYPLGGACVAVRSIELACDLTLDTAATVGVVAEVGTDDDGLSPALTLAEPHSPFTLVAYLAKERQTPEYVASFALVGAAAARATTIFK